MTILLLMCITAFRCSLTDLSGATDMPNESGTITATALDPTGKPVAGAAVTLVPAEYVVPVPPIRANHVRRFAETKTDSTGAFTIDSLDTGSYSIEINDHKTLARRIQSSISAGFWIKKLGNFLMDPYAAVSGKIDTAGTGGKKCFVQIFGIKRLIEIGTDGAFLIDSLPADTFKLQIVSYYMTNPVLVVHRIITKPGDTTIVPLALWKYSQKLYLNTTSSGADVSGMVTNFPVLVRLGASNFDFNKAKSKGEDIRFTKADGTLLFHEIELWDPSQNQAVIWVRVDSVLGNNSTQYITLHWGNENAFAESNAAAVFDTGAGFQGVWHLNQAGNATVLDATGNHYNGTPSTQPPAAAPGMIGTCREFTGNPEVYITMQNTANSRLNFPKDGMYTISAWACLDTLDSWFKTVVGKGNYQYHLKLYRTDKWEFCEYKDKAGQEQSLSPDLAVPKIWNYVTGVRNGTKQYLYINGTCVDSTFDMYNDTASRYEGYNVIIGKLEGLADSLNQYVFKGKIDEVRMSSNALSADWIKLCFMNQGAEDKLIVWKRDGIEKGGLKRE